MAKLSTKQTRNSKFVIVEMATASRHHFNFPSPCDSEANECGIGTDACHVWKRFQILFSCTLSNYCDCTQTSKPFSGIGATSTLTNLKHEPTFIESYCVAKTKVLSFADASSWRRNGSTRSSVGSSKVSIASVLGSFLMSAFGNVSGQSPSVGNSRLTRSLKGKTHPESRRDSNSGETLE